MRKITFLGASSDIVTGSCYLVTDSRGYGILVDMGMFQGNEEVENLNHLPLEFNPRDVHSVILTHAHLDHSGRLPILVKHGFRGRIYATAATKALTEIVLMDSAHITESYREEDVADTMTLFDIVDYDRPFSLSSCQITFQDAGHILGSASILLKDVDKSLIFSGDLGNTPEEIIKPTENFESGDFVVLESTYGDKGHPQEDPNKIILKEINTIEKTGGTLLIPSFSVERTQVMLYKIEQFKEKGLIKKETKVYLDSPMGIKATNIYKSFKNLYNKELQEHSQKDDPFDFPGLEIIEREKDSKKIEKQEGGKIIIAGSGMMAGGRILYHAKRFLPIKTTRLLIVGFQAENTIGRQITEGAKSVRIKGGDVAINAHVTELYSMSAHADQPRLLSWLSNIRGTKRVFLTHGEKLQRDTLAEKIKQELHIESVEKPTLGQVFQLPS